MISRIGARGITHLLDVLQACVAAAQNGAYVRAAMALPPPPEIARRVRAAFAYANKDVSKEHAELGIGYATVQRIVSPTKPRGADSDELEQIAGFTGVPVSFLLDGWPSEAPSAAERLEALEHQYQALIAQIGEARRSAAEALAEQAQTVAQHTRAIEELQAARHRRGQAAGNDQ